jgi:uncharacterized protein (DUF1697 family)
MNTWVVLLRGVNVGGTGRLPMADLRAHIAALGGHAPETYVQSGNAVFSGAVDPDAFARSLSDRIAHHHGHAPRVLVLPAETLIRALAAFPFAEARERPKTGHVWFCAEDPVAPDLEGLAAVAGPRERFALEGRWFFLDAPDGIGRSKLAAKVERSLGVAATARNLNTVMALERMAAAR